MSGIWTAVAAVAGGVLSGVGSAVAGHEAAQATESSTNAAVNEQQWAIQQQEAQEAPYTALGKAAIPQYEALLGLGKGGSAGIQKTLAATPGYQFAKSQGLTSTENAATAQGLGLSGNTLQALDQFSTGLADSTYQNAVGNAAQAVGFGQAAASNTASNIGQGASNISNALISQGNNIAGIDINTIAGIDKSITGGIGAGVTANTLAGLTGSSLPSDPGAYAAGGVPAISGGGGYTYNNPLQGTQ